MANFITQVEIGNDLYLIKDPEGSDEKVRDSSGTSKAYLLGHTSQGSTTTAVTNNNVYMESGKLYAKALRLSNVNSGDAKIDSNGDIIGKPKLVIDCSINFDNATKMYSCYTTAITYSNASYDASTLCAMFRDNDNVGTFRSHVYSGATELGLFDFDGYVDDAYGDDMIFVTNRIVITYPLIMDFDLTFIIDKASNTSICLYNSPAHQIYVDNSNFTFNSVDMMYDNNYFNYNITASSGNSITIDNINSGSIGHLNYFKVVNTTTTSKTFTVLSSSGTLKGGGNITIPAQSIVEFSCSVTHGTTSSEYWAILTHSDSIPL